MTHRCSNGLMLATALLAESSIASPPNQTALVPASDQAAGIASLWMAMLVGGCLIFAAVMFILAVGLWRARRQERRLSYVASRNLVIAAGVAVPLAVLIALVAGSLFLGNNISSRPPDGALHIEVIGWRWWWEIRYLDPDGELIATTANEIHVPVDRPVRFSLTSEDVIHSFWVPNLHGKTDLVPGQTNSSWFTARRAGIFHGQCAEFCGTQHALMGFRVIAQPAAEFKTWLAHQAQPARRADSPMLQRGREAFVSAGCASCHVIRGVTPPALANAAKTDSKDPLSADVRGLSKARTAARDKPVPAPDLTHFGSRLTLAAGARPNTAGHLGGWISDPQGIKPGVLMPPTMLEPGELTALIGYLQSLR
ncbi:cytochrome c oxidase subunit II [Pseudomonas sp. gcc21]|uniref:cytochrome c oxidase subunit II n=1 Tax=Pseudomonas sp. gcc21 TaxID=2726989 RepID=UPI0014526082|nr:cytochrome c oxidase subunit II [Pseudomonas sp. gcc21]QJD58012.1 cytochrome c oxidase subunit II [Pseudomonas sp. gcc21]